MSWSDTYIGLPYQKKGRDRRGIDCYGLLRLGYRELLGIELPSFTEAYGGATERAEISAALEGQISDWPWQSVAFGQQRAFDGLLFGRAGINDHVGIVVDSCWMLHIRAGSESCLARYDEAPWSSLLIGIRRHAEAVR